MGSESNHIITYSIWSKLYRADIIRKSYKYVPEEQNYGEDLICLLMCIFYCSSVALCNNTNYCYRVRDQSMSHLDKEKFFANELNLYSNVLKIPPIHNNHIFYAGVLIGVRRLLYGMIEVSERYNLIGTDRIRGKRIVVFGAGRVGKDYMRVRELTLLSLDVCSIMRRWFQLRWCLLFVIRYS